MRVICSTVSVTATSLYSPMNFAGRHVEFQTVDDLLGHRRRVEERRVRRHVQGRVIIRVVDQHQVERCGVVLGMTTVTAIPAIKPAKATVIQKRRRRPRAAITTRRLKKWADVIVRRLGLSW